MSQPQLTAVVAAVVFLSLAALFVGAWVRNKRRLTARHPALVEAWDDAATELGLQWVVPKETVVAEILPPALEGTVDGRVLYLALRDDKADEDLLPKWVVDLHVTCAREPRSDKAVLKRLRRGKRSAARVSGRELRVQRAGQVDDRAELVDLAREVLAAAEELETR